MTGDPFSDILTLVRAETVLSGGIMAGGEWAVRFPAPERMKFCAIVKGGCWVRVEGRKKPIRAEMGDVLMMVARLSFVLAGDLDATPVHVGTLVPNRMTGMAKVGTGKDFISMGGHVLLDPVSGPLVSEVLPPWIHIQANSPEAKPLRWILEEMLRERKAASPGVEVASKQLAQLMLVHVLRSYVDRAKPSVAGWPRALANRSLASAMRLMHKDPSRSWQLDELAKSAAMSRTTFALKFKSATGVPPLTYLTEWRMQLARRSLREEHRTIADVGRSLGYASESAFSQAFKRVTGVSPKRYQTTARNEINLTPVR